MRQYELTYLVSDNVSESDITKVTGKIGGYVSDEGGKVLKEESWGRRKLAYPINKQLFATYITTSFELEPDKLRSLEREIKHENDVIRHLLIVLKSEKKALILTAEDIAATEEIEKVVGGEKSFEAILGETEESKDLMAVRGEDAEDTSNKMQDTNKSQESKSEAQEEEIEKPVEIVEEPAKIVEEKIEIEKPAEKPIKKITKKTEDENIVIASQPKAAKQSDVRVIPSPEGGPSGRVEGSKSQIAAANDDLAMTETKKVEAKKPVKKKAVKKDDSVSDEADRLAKLNQELDDILGEDL